MAIHKWVHAFSPTIYYYYLSVNMEIVNFYTAMFLGGVTEERVAGS